MITPITWREIEDALVALFSGPTDLTISWKSQSAPRPSFPYGSISITSGPTAIGIDEQRMGDVELEVVGVREITVSFQVYGIPRSIAPESHARAYISALSAALEMPMYHDAFALVGLAVREVMPINLPDEQIGDGFISRAALDVRFGLSSNVSQPMSTIETVSLSKTNTPTFDETIP